jgi:TIR domain
MEKEYLFDVAISFADEDKNAAKALALAFESIDINAYYYDDIDERALGFGQNLENRLIDIYREKAKYAVVLFSENYFSDNKKYTRIELKAIVERMNKDSDSVYLLPIKFKDEFVIEDYSELNNITYLKWEVNPEAIAEAIKTLLGKKLIDKNKAQNSNAFLYSSGNESKVILDEVIVNGNNNLFKNTGNNNVNSNNTNTENVNTNSQSVVNSNIGGDIIQQKTSIDGGLNINVTVGQSEANESEMESETTFPCPNCNYILEFKEYGKIICPKCEKPSFVRNYNLVIDDFNTIKDKKEQASYKKILWHISNKLNDGNYFPAYKYCLQAEEIAPGESSTWESFALTEFLIEINNNKDRKPIFEIVRKVKMHLAKCKMYGIEKNRLEEVSGDIANRLFYYLKKQVNKYHTKTNYTAIQFIKGYEYCYSLYPDLQFLEAYVYELSKPYRWIVQRIGGTLVDLPACGNFPAVANREKMISRIQAINEKYDPPKISLERFIFLKEKTFTDY